MRLSHLRTEPPEEWRSPQNQESTVPRHHLPARPACGQHNPQVGRQSAINGQSSSMIRQTAINGQSSSMIRNQPSMDNHHRWSRNQINEAFISICLFVWLNINIYQGPNQTRSHGAQGPNVEPSTPWDMKSNLCQSYRKNEKKMNKMKKNWTIMKIFEFFLKKNSGVQKVLKKKKFTTFQNS